MDRADTELAGRAVGLEFLMGPEDDYGDPPHRCVITRYTVSPALPASRPPGGPKRRPARQDRCDEAVCSVSPPFLDDEPEAASAEVSAKLSVRFVEAVIAGERTADGAWVVLTWASRGAARRMSFRCLVWTVGTDPYAKNAVQVDCEAGMSARGALFEVVADDRVPREQTGRVFVYVIRPAPGSLPGWKWILLRKDPDARLQPIPGDVGFTNVESPTSFEDSQSRVGRGLLTVSEARS